MDGWRYGLRLVSRTGDWLREAPEGARPQNQTEPVPSSRLLFATGVQGVPDAGGRHQVARGAGVGLDLLAQAVDELL